MAFPARRLGLPSMATGAVRESQGARRAVARKKCLMAMFPGVFLRAVLAKNPHKAVQAAATLSLGRFLNNRLQRIDLCREHPALAGEFAGLFGKAYLAELKRQDRGKVLKEIESVFEQAAEKYGNVKLAGDETVAGLAKAELFSIRNLIVGKEAPDIEGGDQDGRRFQPSDYRGKVVLLDFWSYV